MTTNKHYTDWLAQFSEFVNKSQSLSNKINKIDHSSYYYSIYDPASIMNAFLSANSKLFENKNKLDKAHDDLFQQWISLGEHFINKMQGADSEAFIKPAKNDRRFKDPAWDTNIALDFVRQWYLTTTNWVRDIYSSIDGVNEETKKKIDFFLRQVISAISPNNFPLFNPVVLRECLESGGLNFIKGINNFLKDVETGKGRFHITTTDTEYYKVGVNLANTPGKVIFQNELMQLIQYNPSTKEVYRIPILLVPPWINKFYILDLSPEKSLVKWLVDQGFTVFVVSWVNATDYHANKSFENYMIEGLYAAISAIHKITKEKALNVAGYCLGGTLIACLMAYCVHGKCKKQPDMKIASATLLTTLIDFKNAGDLSTIIDAEHVKNINAEMEKSGFLDGRALSAAFSIIRANDMVWSYVINNYMLGKDPLPNDFLYWNSDYTNIPKAVHSFLLSNMYRDNLLTVPDGIKLNGVPINLQLINTPVFMLSTKEDHIAPWKTTYKGSQFLGNKVTFVLAGSGHVAGVINHPNANKYNYWISKDNKKAANEWFEKAKEKKGSWWLEWQTWLEKYSGNKIKALIPGESSLKAIGNAPGSYVSQRQMNVQIVLKEN